MGSTVTGSRAVRMKHAPQFLPPRQQVIYGYTRRMLDETRLNANSFAMVVAEHYLRSTAPDVRQVKFRLGEGDELCAAMRNNGQILRRYMDGTLKVLPADLEDAWVCSLPEPYRSECERDLGRRRGFLPVQLLPVTEGSEAIGLSRLTSEFAQLLEAVAPALADGRITEADLPHARRILDESDDLIAAVLGMRRQLTALLSEGGVAHA